MREPVTTAAWKVEVSPAIRCAVLALPKSRAWLKDVSRCPEPGKNACASSGAGQVNGCPLLGARIGDARRAGFRQPPSVANVITNSKVNRVVIVCANPLPPPGGPRRLSILELSQSGERTVLSGSASRAAPVPLVLAVLSAHWLVQETPVSVRSQSVLTLGGGSMARWVLPASGCLPLGALGVFWGVSFEAVGATVGCGALGDEAATG